MFYSFFIYLILLLLPVDMLPTFYRYSKWTTAPKFGY